MEQAEREKEDQDVCKPVDEVIQEFFQRPHARDRFITHVAQRPAVPGRRAADTAGGNMEWRRDRLQRKRDRHGDDDNPGAVFCTQAEH